MPYTPTSWVNGATPANATNMNHLETQYSEAMLSFQADLITGFVEAGFVATKDGVTANQLDVTSGSAYIQQSDFTKRLHSNTSTTFTTSAASSTYHLYIQPDGTFYWNTANTPATGSLFIAQVTTDGSGNILAVTDTRNLNPTLLPNLSGEIILPNVTFPKIGGQATVGGFGAPVIMAQALNVNVTGTSAITVLTFTPPVDGLYRVNGYVYFGNSTAESLLFYVSYTDPHSGVATNALFSLINNFAAGSSIILGTANTIGTAIRGISTMPVVFYAKGGAAITVIYQDGAGSPNDFITAVVERLT